MQNLYEVLKNPSIEVLRLHSIDCFDKVIETYPKHYKNIIRYMNDVFNYKSDLLLEEKDWQRFLMERFDENNIPDNLIEEIVHYESADVTYAMSSFLAMQKESIYTTYVFKQNLRMDMLSIMQKPSATTSDKKNANEMVSNLDIEINDIVEKLRNSQKVFGNFTGYDQVKSARNKHKINIAMLLD